MIGADYINHIGASRPSAPAAPWPLRGSGGDGRVPKKKLAKGKKNVDWRVYDPYI